MSTERGLVVSCPVKITETSLAFGKTALDPQELRFSLLFWDKLNFPEINMIRIGLDRDSQFLADEGILSRASMHALVMSDPAGLYASMHVNAYLQLDKAEPGVWSLGVGENSISFPDAHLDVGRGVLVGLFRAIPIPDREVPIQDVLEFRLKHQDELLALRYHLESIYQRIISAGDGELALTSEIENFDKAVADHIKTSKESKLPFRGMSLDASLNIPAAVLAGFSGYAATLSLSASLLAGAAAGFGVNISAALKGKKPSATPYSYVSSFHEKLF